MSEFSDTITDQFRFAQWAASRNLDQMTHADSIVRPPGGGNDFNWILGHVIAVRNRILPALGEEPVWERDRSVAYVTASDDDTSARLPLDELRQAVTATHERLLAGLARADDAVLDAKAPFSPGKNPDETLRSLLRKSVVHESYHVGQLGALRRLAGKEGAIRM